MSGKVAVNPFMSDVNLLLYHSDIKQIHKNVHVSRPFD